MLGSASRQLSESHRQAQLSALPAWPILSVLLVAVIGLKLAATFVMGTWPDEGYYWLWSQRPGLSFYDHPPMGAWLGWLNSAVFGDSIAATRFPSFLTFAGMCAIFWYWIKRLVVPTDRWRALVGTIVIWQCVPAFGYFLWVALLDHYLIFFALLSAHFFTCYVIDRDQGKDTKRHLYAAAFALGWAALTKYSAVFLGGAYLIFVLLRADRASWFRNKHSYGATLLVFLMLTPVLYWNHLNGWPSLQYYLQDRIAVKPYGVGLQVFHFFFFSAMMMSPIFIWAACRFSIGAFLRPSVMQMDRLAAVPFLLGVGFWFVMSFRTAFSAVWNLIAYIGFLPVAVLLFRSQVTFLLHAIFGISASALFLYNASVFPIMGTKDFTGLRTDAIVIDGRGLADTLIAYESEFAPDMLVTTDYLTASQTSFHAQRTDIVHLGNRIDMWDFWFEPEKHKGKNAIVMADRAFPVTDVIDRVFEKVTPVGSYDIERQGIKLHKFELYFAENYRGTGPQ